MREELVKKIFNEFDGEKEELMKDLINTFDTVALSTEENGLKVILTLKIIKKEDDEDED